SLHATAPAPPDIDPPSLHGALPIFTVSDVQSARLTQHSGKRVFELPLIECAAPGPAIVGASVTWLTVLNSYASWSDVLAAHATWADILELIGDPTEVAWPRSRNAWPRRRWCVAQPDSVREI